MDSTLDTSLLARRRSAFARAVMDERRAADKEYQAAPQRLMSTVWWWVHEEARREHGRAEGQLMLARNQYFAVLFGHARRGEPYIYALKQILSHASGVEAIVKALEKWESSLPQNGIGL